MICRFSNFEALEKSLGVCSYIKSCCFRSILIWAGLNSHFLWYNRYPNFLRGGFLSKCERKIRFFKKLSTLLFENSSRTCIFQLDFCYHHCQRIWKMKKTERTAKKSFFGLWNQKCCGHNFFRSQSYVRTDLTQKKIEKL